MDFTSRRVAKAASARDERLALQWLKTVPPAICPAPGCGKPLPTVLPGTGTGRTRTWCSDACRQRAYRARRRTPRPSAPDAATSDSRTATSTASTPSAHTADDCARAVLSSPDATAGVLDAVRRALGAGALDRPEYDDVRTALDALVGERSRRQT